jgi:hypothetical protein
MEYRKLLSRPIVEAVEADKQLKLILFEKQDVLNLRWTGTKTNRFRENV